MESYTAAKASAVGIFSAQLTEVTVMVTGDVLRKKRERTPMRVLGNVRATFCKESATATIPTASAKLSYTILLEHTNPSSKYMHTSNIHCIALCATFSVEKRKRLQRRKMLKAQHMA
jgi:hypothetical protein